MHKQRTLFHTNYRYFICFSAKCIYPHITASLKKKKKKIIAFIQQLKKKVNIKLQHIIFIYYYIITILPVTLFFLPLKTAANKATTETLHISREKHRWCFFSEMNKCFCTKWLSKRFNDSLINTVLSPVLLAL